MTTDVQIVVPSAGRAGKVRCLENLSWCAEGVALAVPAGEQRAYAAAYPEVAIIPVPERVRGIAATRQHLTEICTAQYLMQVSDDVQFFRRDQETLKLAKVSPADMVEMLRRVLELGEQYGHAGVSMRTKNNWWPDSVYVGNKRMCDVYVHDTELLRRKGVRWDRLPVMEDMDVTVSLIRMGFPHAVLYEWCWDQPTTNADGGCSAYRTPEVQKEGALGLEYLHHPFVKAREKKALNWVGFGGTRWDVTVQWKKALAAHDLA